MYSRLFKLILCYYLLLNILTNVVIMVLKCILFAKEKLYPSDVMDFSRKGGQ